LVVGGGSNYTGWSTLALALVLRTFFGRPRST